MRFGYSLYSTDDSDHHYESMYAGNYENQEVPQCPAPPNADIIPFDDEEFDSFESEVETDEDVKKVRYRGNLSKHSIQKKSFSYWLENIQGNVLHLA